ncbi:MAG: hypothetical protein KatS3mg114_0528 [Planctomycetaceae bacterium]|nr:MAG: hypothetical protein KatS3mg114_0528 [Planctomycetaceae bacterium]
MGLLTIDTYRIAAVDQLQTYADLIRVPLKVVHRPEEMPRALEALNQTELVLIDTAGRSPLDNLNLRELQEFLSAGKVSQVQLLLSMTSSRRSLRQAWSQFQPLRPTALILTKMDEAATLGEAFALCKATQLPVSYLTTGQGVPDDIEPAQAGRLARWILGLQSVVQVDDPPPCPRCLRGILLRRFAFHKTQCRSLL